MEELTSMGSENVLKGESCSGSHQKNRTKPKTPGQVLVYFVGVGGGIRPISHGLYINEVLMYFLYDEGGLEVLLE